MIVKFDTPELAKKRYKELVEERKKDKGCELVEEMEKYKPLTVWCVATYEEFKIEYRLTCGKIGVSIQTRKDNDNEINSLLSVMKMQSLMMEV